jgi:hypothetical protein
VSLARSLRETNKGKWVSPLFVTAQVQEDQEVGEVSLPESFQVLNPSRPSLAHSALLRLCAAIQEQPVRINVFERVGPLLQIGDWILVGERKSRKRSFHSRTGSWPSSELKQMQTVPATYPAQSAADAEVHG